MKLVKIAFVSLSIFLPISVSYAGHGTGVVTQVLVGRTGHEVYFQLEGTITSFPCAGSHPSGYNYAFSLTGHAAAKEMLSALLTAYVSGKTLSVQGNGACTIDSTIEDAGYLMLR